MLIGFADQALTQTTLAEGMQERAGKSKRERGGSRNELVCHAAFLPRMGYTQVENICQFTGHGVATLIEPSIPQLVVLGWCRCRRIVDGMQRPSASMRVVASAPETCVEQERRPVTPAAQACRAHMLAISGGGYDRTK